MYKSFSYAFAVHAVSNVNVSKSSSDEVHYHWHYFNLCTAPESNSEHLYHVLVNNRSRAPCSDEVLPLESDPNAPELPPPLEPDSQDNDTPPVYQDITEFS